MAIAQRSTFETPYFTTSCTLHNFVKIYSILRNDHSLNLTITKTSYGVGSGFWCHE